ncbi:MAG: hypothetical protein CVV24_11775 [Ignavibacteriae bacterium HGW-Ignavibacteriae-3]|nr:MAG: hypothetical protein CVV24_11775 [Ignavibacteriae bacterium HGW-Ignavibacteriae-3]
MEETWYFYPIPFLYTLNSDLSKATYGINLSYKNFRGRNETLKALVGIGYDPIYAILYDNPAVLFEDDIGFTFSYYFSKLTNKSPTARKIIGFDYQHKSISQSVAVYKRFNQFNVGYLSVGFTYVETDFSLKGITASGSRIDRLLTAGLSYVYDSRDLKQYSVNGIYSLISIAYNGFGINNISYNKFGLDFREYRTIYKQLSGKWRLLYRSVFGGLVPYYDYSFLGYMERVRGHYNDIREGKNSLLTSFELSYPIIKEWNVNLKLPLLPESLTSGRIGIYFTSFIDAGGTFNGSDSFSLNRFYSGYGFGITILLLPYDAVRFEYSFNELGTGEFIIGTGFSF